MAKLVQLIETETNRGRGDDSTSPCRLVKQWFAPDGELVAERDEWLDGQVRLAVYNFDLENATSSLHRLRQLLRGQA